jgi:hypothetical protein
MDEKMVEKDTDPHTKFSIKSSDDFMNRQKCVFDALNVLEEHHSDFCRKEKLDKIPESQNDEEELEVIAPKRKHKHISYRERDTGSSSKQTDVFKVPRRNNFSHIRKVPDFKVHPEKWVKYSLADVTTEQMSEKGNTRAAMEFLSQQNKVQENEINKETTGQEQEQTCSSSVKPVASNRKWIMPEFTFGKKVKYQKTAKTSNIDIPEENVEKKKKTVKLDHLSFEDEEL